ncbi:MAG: hypothetical protein ABI742_11900 [Gemmatimonadota bacterium]
MNRRGFTLPLTLLTLALMGALACGVMLLAGLRWQSGERSLQAFQARTLAESEVDRLIAMWDPLQAESTTVGAVVAVPAHAAGPGLAAFDSLMRLGHGLYLVRSIGVRSTSDGAVLARDGVAGLVRLLAPSLPDSIAVESAGPVVVSAAGQVDGDDHTPTGWTGVCSAPAPPAIGVLAGAATPVQALCGGGSCIRGSPPIALDSTLTMPGLTQFGVLNLADLVAMADHRISGTLTSIGPAVAGGTCLQVDSLNWGAPGAVASPCGGFFPVIEAAPATRVAGGQGQGVLVATGALELAGDVAFTGVVIAAGPVVMQDQARVTGLVVTLDSLTVTGSALIERSRCALARALLGAARPGSEVERGWFRWD